MFHKSWKEMTTEEKFEWLRQEDQSTRQLIHKMSGEIATAVQKLEKQIADLQNNKK